MVEKDQVDKLVQELEALKAVIAKREIESVKAAENTEAMEKELKQLLKSEKDVKAGSGERVVYVSQSRKIDKFRGRPGKSSAACQSRGLGPKEQAAYIIEHLGGDARLEILGRGEAMKTDPSQIFSVLLRVFGDGDSLPQLQQLFYSYKQREGENLVTCSLALVKIFDRIIQLEPSFPPGRETQLKNRLAEAVIDDSLRTELRRLNTEHPELSYFDARDRVMKLTSSHLKPPVKEAIVCEVSAGKDLEQVVRQQATQIATQQKQIESLMAAISGNRSSERKPRKCWQCDSTEHLKRDCPKMREPPLRMDRMEPLNTLI